MKILVNVKTRSSQNKIEKRGDSEFDIWTKEPPVDGLANKAVIKLIAKYFHVATSQVNIKVGHKTKKKILEIK